jgi:tetratricopeptide (TPR) repeat protein
MSFVIVAPLLLATVPITVEAPTPAVQAAPAYEELSQNRNEEALKALSARYEWDNPSQLINLGTTYVRLGRAAEAQRFFQAAVHSDGRADLLLADGQVMDSRAAAKLALRNLRTQPADRLAVGTLFRR